MSSHKFRNMNSGRSAENEANNLLGTFSPTQTHYGTIFSSANMTHSLEESGLNDLAHMDKRSAHNALERQRRETLNTKFQQLAHTLPSLQSVRRPSKTVIVSKSLDFVSKSIDQESNFQKQIDDLRRANALLRQETQQRAKLQGCKSSTTTTRETTTTSTPSSCSSFPDSLHLAPAQLVVNPEEHIKEASDLVAPTTTTSKSTSTSLTLSSPTSSVAGVTVANTAPTPTTPVLTNPMTTMKRLPSSTSMGSTNTISSSTLNENKGTKRRSSANESATKKRSRHSSSSPATAVETTYTISNTINNNLIAAHDSSPPMSYITPAPYTHAHPDQEVYRRHSSIPFTPYYHHNNSNISSCCYSTIDVMVPRHDPRPLASVPHHHNVAAAAAMGAQQHHLVAPFPTLMPLNDDRAMMPPFQPDVLNMASSFNTAITTPPPSSYIPNPAYHSVIYPEPYPQPDQSAMDNYLW